MSIISSLHSFAWLRKLARRTCRNSTISQPFYHGRIYLDAVEHSWAWTGKVRYETFDRDLQDCLLRLSRNHGVMIDIGANIGAMSLSVLLRNAAIQVIAVEPNPRAAALLSRSIYRNQLDPRVRIIQSACTPADEPAPFDFKGSVVGHISADATTTVTGISPVTLFKLIPAHTSALVKVDIEGAETLVLPQLIDLCRERHATLALELHPLRWNEMGDPQRNLSILQASGACVQQLNFSPIDKIDLDQFTPVIATWP